MAYSILRGAWMWTALGSSHACDITIGLPLRDLAGEVVGQINGCTNVGSGQKGESTTSAAVEGCLRYDTGPIAISRLACY